MSAVLVCAACLLCAPLSFASVLATIWDTHTRWCRELIISKLPINLQSGLSSSASYLIEIFYPPPAGEVDKFKAHERQVRFYGSPDNGPSIVSANASPSALAS